MALAIQFQTALYPENPCSEEIFTSRDMLKMTVGDYGILSRYNYRNFTGGYNQKAQLFCSKYIMEYLYNWHGLVLSNKGHSVLCARKNDWYNVGDKENILNMDDEIKLAVVMIHEIAKQLYFYSGDVVNIAVYGNITPEFFRWAKKTPLEGQVIIKIIQKQNEMTCDFFDDWGIKYYYIDKFESRFSGLLEAQHRSLVTLTKEREEKEYERHCKLRREKLTMVEPSFISIYRRAGGEFKVAHFYSISTYTGVEEMAQDVEIALKRSKAYECVVLAYNKSYLPERLIYDKDSEFYAGFYYKDGVMTQEREKDAFKHFHSFYDGMCKRKNKRK